MSKKVASVCGGGGGDKGFREEGVPQLADGWPFQDHREST